MCLYTAIFIFQVSNIRQQRARVPTRWWYELALANFRYLPLIQISNPVQFRGQAAEHRILKKTHKIVNHRGITEKRRRNFPFQKFVTRKKRDFGEIYFFTSEDIKQKRIVHVSEEYYNNLIFHDCVTDINY